MTTQAQIITAWNTGVWAKAAIQSITPKIYSYPFLDDAERRTQDLYYQAEINCFIYTVTRSYERLTTGRNEQVFSVEVSYYKASNIDGVNQHNAIVSALETVDSYVVSGLGNTWLSTVDYYRPQSGPISITQEEIEETQVYKGTFTYTGTIRISI